MQVILTSLSFHSPSSNRFSRHRHHKGRLISARAKQNMTCTVNSYYFNTILAWSTAIAAASTAMAPGSQM
jgi:hypothetical protein